MKNKKITIILSLMIILGMTVPVFATQTITGTGTTMVSYGVSETYTISIPANFNFTETNLEYTKTISASNVRLENGKTLNVTMSSQNHADGVYTLNCEGTSKIPYTIEKDGQSFSNAGVVLSVESGETLGSSELEFATTIENIQKATLSGAHTDILTFNAEVE